VSNLSPGFEAIFSADRTNPHAQRRLGHRDPIAGESGLKCKPETLTIRIRMRTLDRPRDDSKRLA
jgi:hypothetical protein